MAGLVIPEQALRNDHPFWAAGPSGCPSDRVWRCGRANRRQNLIHRLLGEGMQFGRRLVLHGVRHVDRRRIKTDRRFLLLECLPKLFGQNADAGKAEFIEIVEVMRRTRCA